MTVAPVFDNPVYVRLGKPIKIFQQQVQSKNDVFTILDIDSSRLPDACDMRTLVQNIKSALRHLNPMYRVHGGVCLGEINQYRGRLSVLENLNIYCAHIKKRPVPCHGCGSHIVYQPDPTESEVALNPGEYKRDLANALLKQCMIMFAHDMTKKCTFLVITADPNFASTIASMIDRGHGILVATAGDADAILKGIGRATWLWNGMVFGDRPIRR